ncbi:alcohol dehydrogenase [Rhodococcus sp. KBW08]|uniref:NAD(P)-dependent alcohol dehydrogenase n=1 Tax=Rhodococcus sp. KBW08 TaxID=2144188 RepID=UPI000F592D7E|nr:NAD(P)-dependent alcohol dehydrogenase [Rhodococcus sp. KBW08]RQO46852.1 alcohol dehydrogenase [Rhodococcus sp. KBW08]
MKRMQAAVLRAADQPYSLEEVVLENLRPGEVRVKIVAAGMCHTDLWPRDQTEEFLPVIVGHEGSGIVDAVGPGVHGLEVGTHVVLSFATCRVCSACLRGHPAYCSKFNEFNFAGSYEDGTTSAHSVDGEPIKNRWFGQSSYAEYAVVDADNVVPVERDLPLELLAPLGCSVQTGAGAVLNEMALAPGQSIAVFGAGAVGLAAVMAAKLAGAKHIFVVDLHEERLRMAVDLGATQTILAGADTDVVGEIRKTCDGVDFSFETTSVTKVISESIAVLGLFGFAVLVGGGTGKLSVEPYELAGRKVTFVLEGSAVPRLFVPQLIGFWRAGQFPFDRMIETYGFDAINSAEADSLSGKTIKPVLVMNPSTVGVVQ